METLLSEFTIFFNTWRLEQPEDTKFNMDVSNEFLIHVTKW